MTGSPQRSAECEISFNVNGHATSLQIHAMERLLDVLRHELGLTGKGLQQAFLKCGAAQCGICTPGMILAAFHLLSKKPQPSVDEIREGLAGNLCRCTGYMQIVEAVAEVARSGAAR